MKKQKETVLITGISEGIGAYLAKYFLTNGLKVIGISRQENEDLKKFDDFIFMSCDLFNEVSLSNSLSEILTIHTVNYFIHNAMYTPKHRPFLRYSSDDMAKAFYMATIAPTLIIQKLFSTLKDNENGGRIIFIGSSVTQTGSKGQLAYLTAKSALDGLIKGLALELSNTDITVNQLLLGPVNTPKFIENVNETSKQKIKDAIPTRQFVELSNIAHTIEFLFKKESSAINGTSISVNHAVHLKGF